MVLCLPPRCRRFDEATSPGSASPLPRQLPRKVPTIAPTGKTITVNTCCVTPGGDGARNGAIRAFNWTCDNEARVELLGYHTDTTPDTADWTDDELDDAGDAVSSFVLVA